MRNFAISLVLFLLCACTYAAPVPKVSGASLASVGNQQPGHYAAWVQVGGWNMTTDMKGWTCSAHTYTADINPAWEAEMKEALTTAVEKVDFVSANMAPADISAKGYDAFLILSQSNAKSTSTVNSGFFTATAVTQTQLDAILIILNANGNKQQQSIQSHGEASSDVFTCDKVEEAVANSAGVALQELVKQAIVTTKLLLAQSGQHTASQ
jgi:hypothetical protein